LPHYTKTRVSAKDSSRLKNSEMVSNAVG